MPESEGIARIEQDVQDPEDNPKKEYRIDFGRLCRRQQLLVSSGFIVLTLVGFDGSDVEEDIAGEIFGNLIVNILRLIQMAVDLQEGAVTQLKDVSIFDFVVKSNLDHERNNTSSNWKISIVMQNRVSFETRQQGR